MAHWVVLLDYGGEREEIHSSYLQKALKKILDISTSGLILDISISVGYILGLGDRHVQNILLDEESAELVHIDLGMYQAKNQVFRF